MKCRLTYLFRLCFTGYFQIVVSPETFWLKDFNLILRFACCFNFKKPTHPSPKLCFCLCYYFVWVISLLSASWPAPPHQENLGFVFVSLPWHPCPPLHSSLLPGDQIIRLRCIRFPLASLWRHAFDIPAFNSTIPTIGNFVISPRLAAFPCFRTVDTSWGSRVSLVGHPLKKKYNTTR